VSTAYAVPGLKHDSSPGEAAGATTVAAAVHVRSMPQDASVYGVGRPLGSSNTSVESGAAGSIKRLTQQSLGGTEVSCGYVYQEWPTTGTQYVLH
jgi:hypothetical protein